MLQWTVGGTKTKKKGKAAKVEKKGAMKKQMNKAASSGSSDKDTSPESSAPEEGNKKRMSVLVMGRIHTWVEFT